MTYKESLIYCLYYSNIELRITKSEINCKYWLRLVFIENSTELEKEREKLVQEATELTNIFGAIIHKSK